MEDEANTKTPTLAEIKTYLRVDGTTEDDLITHFIAAAVSTIENILRHPISDYDVVPDDIRTAIDNCYAIYVGCNEVAKMLWELFEDEGYTTPIEDIRTPVLYPAFFIYDQDNYHWLYLNDLEEEYNRLLELKTTAENILLQ